MLEKRESQPWCASAAALERAAAAGEIAAEPGAKSARYLVCVVQGLNVLANTQPSRMELDTIVSELTDICRRRSNKIP